MATTSERDRAEPVQQATVDDVMSAVSDGDLRHPPRLARAVAGGWSPRTRYEYSACWRGYRAWCRPPLDGATRPARWWTPMPTPSEALADYVQHLAERGLKPSTINKHRAAVMGWHRLCGHPVPDGAPALGVQREHERTLARAGWVKKRAPALRVEDAVRCLLTLDLGQPKGMRNACMLLVAFAGLLRADDARNLDIASFAEDAEGLRITLPGTKTTVHATGSLLPHWISEDGEHHPALCPVEAVQRWQAYLIGRGAPRTSPLLRAVDKHGYVAGIDDRRAGHLHLAGRMSTRRLNSAFQEVVRAAGLERASLYTFHSLRIGGASELRRQGATIEEVADAGRWSRHSSVVMEYLRAAEQWIDVPMAKVGAYAVDRHLSTVLSALEATERD